MFDVDSRTAALEKPEIKWHDQVWTGRVLSFPQMAPFIQSFNALGGLSEAEEADGLEHIGIALKDLADLAKRTFTLAEFKNEAGADMDVDAFLEDLPSPVLVEAVVDFFAFQAERLGGITLPLSPEA